MKTIQANIEIILGEHIAKSNVFINGMPVAVSELHIFVSGNNPVPKINLTLPIFKGKLLRIKGQEAEVTLEELVSRKEEHDAETKRQEDNSKTAQGVRKG